MNRIWRSLPFWRSVAAGRSYRQDLLAAAAYLVIALAIGRNLLAAGYPPGVDTPTFLHLSWFTVETLQGRGGLIDPYWYGGFSAFTTYPPLSYGVVGLLAALPGVGLVFVYKVAVFASFAGTGYATYFLTRQLGHSRPWAALGGALALTSYPLLVAVGLWGWFSSFFALPLALLSLGLLERAYQRNSRRDAFLAGLAMGASFLAHHMTAGAMVLGLPFWFLFHFMSQRDQRRELQGAALLFTAAALGSTLWWALPWLANLLEADFHREIPGLWSFSVRSYVRSLADRTLIGWYTYPNYIGIGLTALAIGGILHSFVTRSRTLPYTVLLLLLLAFSLGEQTNPLIRVGPLTGLDVARFQLYLAPVLVVVGLPFLASVPVALGELIGQAKAIRWVPRAGVALAIALLLVQAAWDSVQASSRMFHTYRLSPEAEQMVAWLGEEGQGGKVLGVGFWNWDDFFLPARLHLPVVDGWHDEGAANWREVRPLRIMMWTGQIDVVTAHSLLDELDGRYIAIQDYFFGESPHKFREALRQHPELFDQVADWGQVTLFERIS
ncbi:MAG: hypothetical protein HY532_00365 [Chloroflexi bacterium]|nr:hypothetical protein [Chloroflexota bacterium]